MGKEIKVTCDDCTANVYKKEYYTLNIRKVDHGVQKIYPAIYLCPRCFKYTGLIPNLKENE